MRVPNPEFEEMGPIVSVDDPFIIRAAEKAFTRAGEQFDLDGLEWRAGADRNGDLRYCAWNGSMYYVGISNLHTVVDGKIVKAK